MKKNYIIICIIICYLISININCYAESIHSDIILNNKQEMDNLTVLLITNKSSSNEDLDHNNKEYYKKKIIQFPEEITIMTCLAAGIVYYLSLIICLSPFMISRALYEKYTEKKDVQPKKEVIGEDNEDNKI